MPFVDFFLNITDCYLPSSSIFVLLENMATSGLKKGNMMYKMYKKLEVQGPGNTVKNIERPAAL